MYWNNLNANLKQEYGCKVYKLALSSGCSCPNRDGTISTGGCIFCDGAGAFASAGPIAQQLAAAKALVAAKAGTQAKYIAYFQSFTNTYAPVATLRPLFTAALAPNDIVALSIATRPDCLGEEMMELLRELRSQKPIWVELGLQTIHSVTAQRINRGYELEVYNTAVERLNAARITVVAHQILGLPGENKAMMVETARYIGQSGAAGIKFHLLHVLRGTPLAQLWYHGECPTLEREEYIQILEECLRHIPRSMVVHRLTGDGAKRDLLAPLWSADKKRVLNAIHQAFARDNLEQGSALGDRQL